MRWAVIGASTIAAEHMINAIRVQPGAAISCVVSTGMARAATFAAQHGIDHATTDLHAALHNPDITAVYISSTNEKHHAQAMAAIAAGKHVLCEKPLAMTQEHAGEMVAAARAAGVVLATNHHLRCAGAHRAIAELIADGKIGQVLSVRLFHAVHLPPHLQGWRISDVAAGGGVIADITVHDADTLRFLLGEDPVDVVAQASRSDMVDGVEDSVMSIWTMPSGAMVFAHESFIHAFAGSGLEVHGTTGSIIARGVMTQRPVGQIELVTGAGRRAVPYAAHDLYGQSVRQFMAAVTGTGLPAADGSDGAKSLAVALAVRQAALTGTRQRIDYRHAV